MSNNEICLDTHSIDNKEKISLFISQLLDENKRNIIVKSIINYFMKNVLSIKEMPPMISAIYIFKIIKES